jgi:simple sugar transport system permease protein
MNLGRTLRLQRFPSTSPLAAIAARVLAIVLALGCAGIVLTVLGADAPALGLEVLEGTFGSTFGLEDLGLLITPLILTGLAVAVALRMGLWNIGAEGQFMAGALAAGAVGIFVSGPTPVMLVLMFVAGILGGMLWILIPALARAYASVSELITTLLLNFVAGLLVYYVATGPWRDRAGNMLAATYRIPYEIPELYGLVHWGFALAIVIAIVMAAVLAYTRWGYEVRISGANPDLAAYAGLAQRGHIITVLLVSGGIAGIAGMFEVAGTAHRIQGGISNNFGYLGIMVAVLARGSCLGVLAAAALMATILSAGTILQTQGITNTTVLALTGLILFFTAIGDELAHHRLVRTGSEPARRPGKSAAAEMA